MRRCIRFSYFYKVFKLYFKIPASSAQIHYSDAVLSMGSCFSGHIGEKMANYKFDVLSNPFGTIYNPISIIQLIKNALDEKMDSEELIEVQGVYYHWQAHSAISAMNEDELLSSLKKQIRKTHHQLIKSDWIIITFGSAYVYKLKTSGKIVANCHKVPKSEFTKELLTVKEITLAFKSLLKTLKPSNIKANILLTISPVRHIKDGLIENNLSKSILIQAVQELVNTNEQVHYFPAYEIMIDELRDYRFYKEDLVHPSEQAVNYIWDRLVSGLFDHESQKFVEDWTKLLKAINHRPFHPNTTEHQQFIQNTIDKLNSFKYQVDVSQEIEILQQQLI
jgi:lysophospholipase L1-like esterase